MVAFWTRYRATRAAISVVSPLVDLSRTRFGAEIPAEIWWQPYMIGYISMLITIVGRMETRGSISDGGLARTQFDAWSAITGLNDDRIGEDICILSAATDDAFMLGCRNAAHFMQVYYSGPIAFDRDVSWPADGGRLDESTLAAFGKGGVAGYLLWHRYFDDVVIERG